MPPPSMRMMGSAECSEETSTTHHEPTIIAECVAAPPYTESTKDPQAIAEIASKACQRASIRSNVLSRTKLADIALLSMEELTIGKMLGKGSFSNAHEITKIVLKEGDNNQDDATKYARTILATNYLRKETDSTSSCRYAIKFLKADLRQNNKKYVIGTTDLVIEGLFLASLSHPNIIKVRGLPDGGVHTLVHNGGANGYGYFLVLDRLFDTLSERIYKHWVIEHSNDQPGKMENLFGRLSLKGKVRDKRNEDLAVRVKVAFDIAAALKYLHEKNIIYRDLKPENLGFDVRGDIKLFDLGLVKELHPHDQDCNGNWKLSLAGTPRYLSPEVGMYKPYNLSADVYSFSVLLWEIVSLHQPLKGFTYSEVKRQVFCAGYRPPLNVIWNRQLRYLIEYGWHRNSRNRPNMNEIYDKLRDLYTELKPGSVSEEEVSHNRRRSTFISARFSLLSMRHLLTVERKESNENEGGKVTETA